MDLSKIRFAASEKEAKAGHEDFYKVLRKRVNSYFKENNISRHANANMVVKSIFMISLYIVPFILMLTYFESTGMVLLMWILMGFGMSGIGLSVMHDANHNAYSKNQWVNNIMGKLLLPIGGSPVNWRIQHNVLHHTYTNVTGMDEDIDTGILMRFSPNQKRRKAHSLQHIYAWFLYGFMTIMWFSTKDFSQLERYKKKDLLKTQNVSYRFMLMSIILTKICYLGVFLGLPLIFSSLPWYGVIGGYFLMHFIAGVVLATIFQPAHVIPTSNFPMPNDTGNIETDWAVSQLMNTANFAPKSTWFSWYVGGLNFQVEHHLFPNICHVHYKKISHIVRETAFEYNLPYYSYKTFADALFEHGKQLYRLGRKEPKLATAEAK
ncbi:MAG: acyl-CoA desaturase [Crocinitomicaceae bacterium]|nr:acyl-CoA desaturase [Crocinitomicaceae bacterium]